MITEKDFNDFYQIYRKDRASIIIDQKVLERRLSDLLDKLDEIQKFDFVKHWSKATWSVPTSLFARVSFGQGGVNWYILVSNCKGMITSGNSESDQESSDHPIVRDIADDYGLLYVCNRFLKKRVISTESVTWSEILFCEY